MSDYLDERGTRKRLRKFACHGCGERFHIVRADSSGHWVRYMPPNYCPCCGAKVVSE